MLWSQWPSNIPNCLLPTATIIKSYRIASKIYIFLTLIAYSDTDLSILGPDLMIFWPWFGWFYPSRRGSWPILVRNCLILWWPAPGLSQGGPDSDPFGTLLDKSSTRNHAKPIKTALPKSTVGKPPILKSHSFFSTFSCFSEVNDQCFFGKVSKNLPPSVRVLSLFLSQQRFDLLGPCFSDSWTSTISYSVISKANNWQKSDPKNTFPMFCPPTSEKRVDSPTYAWSRGSRIKPSNQKWSIFYNPKTHPISCHICPPRLWSGSWTPDFMILPSIPSKSRFYRLFLSVSPINSTFSRFCRLSWTQFSSFDTHPYQNQYFFEKERHRYAALREKISNFWKIGTSCTWSLNRCAALRWINTIISKIQHHTIITRTRDPCASYASACPRPSHVTPTSTLAQLVVELVVFKITP